VITNSISSLLLGSVAALFFMLLMALFKKLRWYIVVENYVHVLFALMGISGGLISPLFVSESLKDINFNLLMPNYLPSTQNQFVGVGISMAIGLVGGLIVSPMINLVN
jgi:ammonia channel protein AmtB